MNRFKQNIWVVSILFFSLMSSVALSYAIISTPENIAETTELSNLIQMEQPNNELAESATSITIRVVK